MKPRYVEKLNQETIKKLENLRKKGKNSKERERSHAILLSDQKVSPKELGKIFNKTRRTIYNWLKEWEEKEVESFILAERGRNTIFDENKHKEAVEKHIEKYPHQPKKILALIQKEQNIKASHQTFIRFLKKTGIKI